MEASMDASYAAAFADTRETGVVGDRQLNINQTRVLISPSTDLNRTWLGALPRPRCRIPGRRSLYIFVEPEPCPQVNRSLQTRKSHPELECEDLPTQSRHCSEQ